MTTRGRIVVAILITAFMLYLNAKYLGHVPSDCP